MDLSEKEREWRETPEKVLEYVETFENIWIHLRKNENRGNIETFENVWTHLRKNENGRNRLRKF